MRYQVPQFTDVEDKIFGPLTLKQFVYLAGGAGIAFLLWRSLPLMVAIPLMFGVMVLAFSLAFVQVNNRPLIEVAEAAFMYLIRGKLYLWSAKHTKKKENKQEAPITSVSAVPTLSESKISDLAWSLDINERIHKARKRKVQ